LKVESLGKVSHGVTLSRVEAKPGEKSEVYKLFTMQDLSKETGQYGLKVEIQEVTVNIEKFDKRLLSKEKMVLIGLTSYKAIVINNEHRDKIIPSNFAIVELDFNLVDPFYFAWCFNEHPEIEKSLQVAMQGTIIKALSIQMLREIEMPIPSLDVQKNIGKIYELKKRKEKAIFEKNVLEEKLYKHLLVKKLKEDIQCQ
jgi:restriction endonuclease S subunit